MKLRLISLSVLALALSVFLHAENYSSRETFTRTGAFSPTGKITLDNTNGEVVVRTWDRNEILIEGEKSAKTDEELKLIELNMDLTESKAAIKVHLPKRGGFFSGGNIRASVSFKITLPATAVIEKIDVVNASVDIKGIRGSVNAESVNGRIRAHDLGGNVRLGTVNGEIDAAVSTVAAGQKLSFHTVNGSILVVLPEDTGAEFHSSVVNGSIDCDFPVGLRGKISGRNVSGKIGDGRASLEAESVNGSIRLKKN